MVGSVSIHTDLYFFFCIHLFFALSLCCCCFMFPLCAFFFLLLSTPMVNTMHTRSIYFITPGVPNALCFAWNGTFSFFLPTLGGRKNQCSVFCSSTLHAIQIYVCNCVLVCMLIKAYCSDAVWLWLEDSSSECNVRSENRFIFIVDFTRSTFTINRRGENRLRDSSSLSQANPPVFFLFASSRIFLAVVILNCFVLIDMVELHGSATRCKHADAAMNEQNLRDQSFFIFIHFIGDGYNSMHVWSIDVLKLNHKVSNECMEYIDVYSA